MKKKSVTVTQIKIPENKTKKQVTLGSLTEHERVHCRPYTECTVIIRPWYKIAASSVRNGPNASCSCQARLHRIQKEHASWSLWSSLDFTCSARCRSHGIKDHAVVSQVVSRHHHRHRAAAPPSTGLNQNNWSRPYTSYWVQAPPPSSGGSAYPESTEASTPRGREQQRGHVDWGNSQKMRQLSALRLQYTVF